MKVVGLGKAGCAIAAALSKFPQYTVYKFDTDVHGENCFPLAAKKTHEEYDKDCPIFPEVEKIDGEVLFILAGSGKISGASLRILQQFKNANVTVLYIQPDVTLLAETEATQEKIVRNILQEYARSGLLERIYLVANPLVEACIGDVPIMGYYESLNQAISNTFHMLNIFKHSDAVLGTFTEPMEISRISTLGVVDIENGEEKWFFDLQLPRDVVYYYGISEKELATDGSLFKHITSFVKSKIEEGVNVSYGVYKTNYEQKYCYCIKHSSVVQSYVQLLDDQDIG